MRGKGQYPWEIDYRKPLLKSSICQLGNTNHKLLVTATIHDQHGNGLCDSCLEKYSTGRVTFTNHTMPRPVR